LIELLDGVQQALSAAPDDPLLLRAIGQIHERLNDREGAIIAYQRACASGQADLSSMLSLAELLQDESRLDEAQHFSQRLIDGGWDAPEKSSLSSAIRVIKVHWVVAIWLEHFEEAKKASKEWRESKDLRPTLGCIYITAMRRSVERESDASVVEAAIADAFTCLDELFKREGYLGFVVHEGFNLLDTVSHLARKREFSAPRCRQICNFLDLHLLPMCGEHRERRLDDEDTLSLLAQARVWNCGDEPNPLRAERWTDISLTGNDDVLGEYGYVPATIYHRPQGRAGGNAMAVFARGKDGTEYYVSRRATAMSANDFDGLKDGDLLSVRPADEGDEGKAWPVSDAIRL
jgi:tetratricopeptide (TPR) repeat protein